jgi:CDP-glucose 4,6-dehydratase
VEAYLTSAEQAAEPDVCGRPFNFGIGAPATALEVVKTVISVSDNPALEPIILGTVTHEIQDEYLSTQRAQEILGWQPRHSLEHGVMETMAWYRDYLAGA